MTKSQKKEALYLIEELLECYNAEEVSLEAIADKANAFKILNSLMAKLAK